MQREFSKELIQDRDFEIGGQVFTWRYPHWEDGAALFDDEGTPVDGSEGQFSFKADTEFAIERIPMFLEDDNDAHTRWTQLVARKKDAVPRQQIVELYRWLVQETSGFPTKQPLPSENGAGANDTSSEVESSSLEEIPVA